MAKSKLTLILAHAKEKSIRIDEAIKCGKTLTNLRTAQDLYALIGYLAEELIALKRSVGVVKGE